MGVDPNDAIPEDADETLVEDAKDWPAELRSALPQTAPPAMASDRPPKVEPLRTMAMERLRDPREVEAVAAAKPKAPAKVERTPTLRPPSFHQSSEDSKPRIVTMHGVPLQKMNKSPPPQPTSAQSWATPNPQASHEAEDQAETMTAKRGSPMANQLRDAMLNATLQPGFGTPNPAAPSRFQQTLSFVRHDESSPVSPLLAGPPEAFATTATADPAPMVAPPPPQKEPETLDVLPPVNQQGALIAAPVFHEQVAPRPADRRPPALAHVARRRTHRALGIIAIIAFFLVGAAVGILVGVLQNP
jgi:hypothetical protein